MSRRPDARLAEAVHLAEAALRSRLAHTFGVESPVLAWLDTRFGGDPLAEVFLEPGAYPVVRMPWWAAGEALSGDDLAALSRSSIAGYLFIRIVDDVADRDHAVPAAVLPALSFFHSEFTRVFREWFPAEHEFWGTFDAGWLGTAAAAADDLAAGPTDRDAFERSAGRKTNAALIPVAAALHRIGRSDAIGAWEHLVGAFGRWHQFQNDLEGLAGDQASGATTWIISTARRHAAPGMSPRAWAWTEGLDWVTARLDEYVRDVREAAIPVASTDLDAYLETRFSIWQQAFDTVRFQLETIAAAAAAAEE